MLPLTWFDDKMTYRFFRESGDTIHKAAAPIGHVKPYLLNPDAYDLEERKKRIKVLSSIYGNEYAQRLLYFHLSLDRFLRLKMPINRLSMLLNETFFYFERYLYTKVKWQQGELDYYRDHSLHAANESYLGYEILGKLNHLEQKFIEFFSQNNEATRYINDNCRIGRSEDKLKQIIYRTWFIASLFHDLGHVLSFKKEIQEYMLRFHRYSDLITGEGRSSFGAIRLLLGNSLLFNTVKQEELEGRYNNNKHDTLSAFLLLSTFYTPPAFEGIDILDRVAVELAAQAVYYHDYPEENEMEPPGKMEPSGPECSGEWSGCFKEPKRLTEEENQKIEKLLNEHQWKLYSVYEIDLSVVKEDNSNKTLKPIYHGISPFALYLCFIDKLHVFGRNCFSIDAKESVKGKEKSFRFIMPEVKNIVRYPAQIVQCKNNHLRVYFVADASLYSKRKPNQKENPFYDYGHNRLDGDAIKFFLKDLYWIKKSTKESAFFDDVEFYFIESWPKELI